jgi:hypothetical protein
MEEQPMRIQAVAAAFAACAVFASGAAGAPWSSPWPKDIVFTPFTFETIASRNPDFDRSPYRYESGDHAGQVNQNTGDVRLDGVKVDAKVYTQSGLQLVTSAKIIIDDAVDTSTTRGGGGNLAPGYGIGSNVDPWVKENSVATSMPTTKDLVANFGNFNLTSIVAVRENVGTTIFEVSFAKPTDMLFIWERGTGATGDFIISAIDDSGKVLGAYKVLDGAGDKGAPSDYTRTGIVVTTYNSPTFINEGQELGSIGLRLNKPARNFRFTIYEEPDKGGAVQFNGPDLKVVALRSAD